MKPWLFALTILVVISCNESPETLFEKNGVSVTCPEGWKITDDEAIEDQGYYVSIEKTGFGSSGLVTITWIKDSLDLNNWIETFQNELRSNIIYKHSNLNFEYPKKSKFNKTPTLSVTFNASIIGVKHIGVIHVFHGNNKTFAILKQEAEEDIAENYGGFDLIEYSFKFE